MHTDYFSNYLWIFRSAQSRTHEIQLKMLTLEKKYSKKCTENNLHSSEIYTKNKVTLGMCVKKACLLLAYGNKRYQANKSQDIKISLIYQTGTLHSMFLLCWNTVPTYEKFGFYLFPLEICLDILGRQLSEFVPGSFGHHVLF